MQDMLLLFINSHQFLTGFYLSDNDEEMPEDPTATANDEQLPDSPARLESPKALFSSESIMSGSAYCFCCLRLKPRQMPG